MRWWSLSPPSLDSRQMDVLPTRHFRFRSHWSLDVLGVATPPTSDSDGCQDVDRGDRSLWGQAVFDPLVDGRIRIHPFQASNDLMDFQDFLALPLGLEDWLSPRPLLEVSCRTYLRVSACVLPGMFLGCRTCRNMNKCVFSSVLTPCVWVCVLVKRFHHGNICSMSCTYRACQSDDTQSGTVGQTAERRPWCNLNKGNINLVKHLPTIINMFSFHN